MIVERPVMERRVLASLDAGRIPVLLGGCGSGRTSVLLRLSQLLGASHAQYLAVSSVATTPERCLASVLEACAFRTRAPRPSPAGSPRVAFDAMTTFFDQAIATDGAGVTFLLDEVLDIGTFESFPGLRHVQKELVARLALSPNRFVLASRFTARAHRLLRDAPARFEVMHVAPLDVAETYSNARLFQGVHAGWADAVGPAVHALTDGRAGYAMLLSELLATMGPSPDPIAALAALMSADGRVAARCHQSYEFRLHRARGYGALKAILGILAEREGLNLTEIAQQLHRTPGSTKDYLSWLEDVDLIVSQRKRYTFEDPVLRLYVRLHARAVPPNDTDLVREVRTYAQARLLRVPEAAHEPALAAADRAAEPARSGIIEID